MKKVKIAVIGVGNIAESHIEAYQANPNVELYAFCDINKERLEEKGARFGITRLYTDEAEMLKALPELDAVSVCTWNNQHAPCTILALEAGKNVLCEKPMADSTAAAEQMLEAARRSGKLLQIGFVCRYGRDCKLIEDLRDKDFFGDFYYAKATYLRRHGSPSGWFTHKKYSSGGPLIDLGVHVIDLTRFLMENPKPVSVYGVTFDKRKDRPECTDPFGYIASSPDGQRVFDVEDLAVALVRYDNGAVLEVETSYSLDIKEDQYKLELFGTKSGVKMGQGLEFYTEVDGHMMNMGPAYSDYYTDESHLFSDEIDHFVDCVQNGTPCRAPAEDGIAIMKILEAIYESARTGHEVTLK